MTFTQSDIRNIRLCAQQLCGSSFRTAPQLVSHFGAIQGQEYAQARWSVGLRLPHLRDEDVEQALTDGHILRTHLIRSTWHFVAAADIRWLLQLTAHRVMAINAYMYRKLELDEKVFARTNSIIEKALGDNGFLTREELQAKLQAQRIVSSGPRLSYIMMQAELEGIICSGPRRGNRFTYALIDARAPHAVKLDRDAALAAFAGRYFGSRGPATLHDFATWSGLTMTDCKRAVSLIPLQQRECENQRYFFLQEETAHTKDRLYLLPVYDELLMGYKDRSAFLEIKRSLQPAPVSVFDATIVRNGQIIGTWRRDIGNRSIDLEYRFFRPPQRGEKRLFEEAVQQYSEFTGQTVYYTEP